MDNTGPGQPALWAARSAEHFLATRTDAQLSAALTKGDGELRLIDQLEASEPDMAGGGPERLSRAYQTWSSSDYENRRRMIARAMDDTRQEIARRAALSHNKDADHG
jgi:hypothetical protein